MQIISNFVTHRNFVSSIAALALVACDSAVEEEGAPKVGSSIAVGPNEGYMFRLVDADEKSVGTAEIKLHDDKGDLEIWLNEGGLAASVQGGKPWDLPLDSQLKLEFPELEKEAVLVVRDGKTNANESGKSMIREGKTNYFIFPGDSGADASWLKGHEFQQSAVLTFEAEGVKATTHAIKLMPHGHHAGGHGHSHPHPH